MDLLTLSIEERWRILEQLAAKVQVLQDENSRLAHQLDHHAHQLDHHAQEIARLQAWLGEGLPDGWPRVIRESACPVSYESGAD